MDGTFKVIKALFTQLYSIHAFVKQNGDIKQVPLGVYPDVWKKKTGLSTSVKGCAKPFA